MTFSAGSISSAGFTVLELLVVLSIVAGMLALAPPLFSSAVTANEPRSAARQMMSALRYARSAAVARRQPVAFTLDLAQRRYQVDGHPLVTLPQALDLSLDTAESELDGAGRGMIRFFADGSATGGRITVGNQVATLRLDVAWLTGKVTLLE